MPRIPKTTMPKRSPLSAPPAVSGVPGWQLTPCPGWDQTSLTSADGNPLVYAEEVLSAEGALLHAAGTRVLLPRAEAVRVASGQRPWEPSWCLAGDAPIGE